jgi:hypothetical protein
MSALMRLSVNRSEGPWFEIDSGEGVELRFQFTFRGLLKTLWTRRSITLMIEYLEEGETDVDDDTGRPLPEDPRPDGSGRSGDGSGIS